MIPALDRELRGTLERKIVEARDVAERGARAVLEHYGVFAIKPPQDLNEVQRETRRRLREHGRAVGDVVGVDGSQSSDHLIEETAYEHWHRMLFARYLAENGLLMYQDDVTAVPVTLSECKELVASDIVEDAEDGWDVAGAFASRMLPQIFRIDSPVLRVRFSPEHRQRLERLVEDLPVEVFTAGDSLGWVYQYWQSTRKKEVNDSGVKIGARELPAVTQLFTEQYMVQFLLDNTLGAWWASRRLDGGILQSALSDAELRNAAAVDGVPLSYLRFVRSDGGVWAPAGGRFEAWPREISELRILDPACGSGHFLVAVFHMLTAMRMEIENLSPPEAVDRVLSENLHGLDIDRRVTEIAAFNLALAAWLYPESGGFRPLPQMHVACSGLAIGAKRTEWLALAREAGDDTAALAAGMEALYDLFVEAPTLGSLINPRRITGDWFRADYGTTASLLEEALQNESSDLFHESAIVAHGLAKAASLLSASFHLVITNVPYLSRGKQNETLRAFCEAQYGEAKGDLATVFLDRILELLENGGTVSAVLPQNWLFLSSYTKFRTRLLKDETWHLLARLGPGAFETISGEVVKAVLLTLSRGNSGAPGDAPGMMRGLDVSELKSAAEKDAALLSSEIVSVEQAKQLENPDARIALEIVSGESLDLYADSYQGIKTGDDPRYRRYFWEQILVQRWQRLDSTVEAILDHGGTSSAVDWSIEGRNLARLQGIGGWNKKGVAISQMRSLPTTLYSGSFFDSNVSAVTPYDNRLLPAIWSYCSSPEYNEAVRRIDQSLKVTNATLVQVPFDLDRWTKVAEENYPNGLPEPYSDDPTQWIFHGHPCGSVIWDEVKKWTAQGPLRRDNTVLHIAVARLLGYRWPAELDAEMELSAESRAWVKKTEMLLHHADSDGIVCIPSVRGERPAADRLLDLVADAYGEQWTHDTLPQLLSAVGYEGKTLETWLRDGFFSQHCTRFNHRPFIWHIWDGLADGFSVLVNYHKLDYKNLETLIYTYLGDWIFRQKTEQGSGVDGAGERIAAAERLKENLEKILHGENPYDIFVRWKPLAEQPFGWNPDLNDGVRLNIRPFLTVPDVKKKGAGCLRDKSNINWKKDRGKDVESAPWYNLGPKYGGNPGDRINDHHVSLAEKKKGL